MFITILLVLLLLVSIAAAIISRRVDDDLKIGWGIGAVVLIIGTVVTFVLSSFVVVSTRNIGVVTTFGRPVGTIPNGLHFTWPWQSVTELDGAIQIDWHKDADNGDGHGDAIVVRLGNNSNAWTDTSVRWEMKLDAADDLFLQYKTFDNIRTNLVTRNLQTALNEVFAGYNPLSTLNPADPAKPVAPQESQLPALAKSATEIMQKKVGDQITVFEVQIPTISFDKETQGKIDQLNQQRAATAVALEAKATADAQNAANKALESSLTPEILQSKCLDVVREKGGPVFGCLPGAQAVPTIPVPTP